MVNVVVAAIAIACAISFRRSSMSMLSGGADRHGHNSEDVAVTAAAAIVLLSIIEIKMSSLETSLFIVCMQQKRHSYSKSLYSHIQTTPSLPSLHWGEGIPKGRACVGVGRTQHTWLWFNRRR